jgi:hypothetical protein
MSSSSSSSSSSNIVSRTASQIQINSISALDVSVS